MASSDTNEVRSGPRGAARGVDPAAGAPPTDGEWEALAARGTTQGAAAVVYGVRTTGVHCRAGCPARTPLRSNVRVFAGAAAAQAAGYRACKRCGGG